VGAVWLGLGIKTAGNHDTFYVLFFPVIWIAVRRGLRGAATGILLLDIGIVLSLEFSGGDSARFLVLQLLMLVLSLTGLILGTLISERNRTERRLSQEEERMRVLLSRLAKPWMGWTLMGIVLSVTRHFCAGSDRWSEYAGAAGKECT
jgi:glucose-6-phosphate-specific signal transduction histidine kinase